MTNSWLQYVKRNKFVKVVKILFHVLGLLVFTFIDFVSA